MTRFPVKGLGARATATPGHAWVQTERVAHEEWSRLVGRRPRAAQLLHLLIAQMGSQNAVVISQAVLAKIMGCSAETIKRAVRDLVAERWIQIVKLNGPGTVNAYVVNSRVAWAEKRDNLRLSLFHAVVVSDAADQDTLGLDETPLRRIPVLFPGERQLPTGPGLPPPSQPSLDGLEPDLPSTEGAEL